MQVHGNFVHVHSIMFCRVSSDILRPMIVLPMTLRSIDELGIKLKKSSRIWSSPSALP